MSIRERYPTDLTDAQWAKIEPLIPKPKPGGRPATVSRREIVNAIFYHVRNGGTWRAMPHDLPHWKTVHHYFSQWRDDGTWQRVHDAVRDDTRRAAGRDVSPSAAILDAQSVKTAEPGTRARVAGPAAGLTGASSSRVASVTSPSIRSGSC
jgi:transposase